jgi:uncharacterized protein involved in oxidation of intracellular sulfur
MKNLVILNDAPYGNERSYNGLRLALTLAKSDGEEVRLFLIGDAAACAKHGQKTPNGFYNIESMLKGIAAHGAEIAVCGSCMDARAIDAGDLMPGSMRGSMEVLTSWTREAEKVIVF